MCLGHLEIRWKLYHLVERKTEFWSFELDWSLHCIADVDYELEYQSSPNSTTRLEIRVSWRKTIFRQPLWLFGDCRTWRCGDRGVIRLWDWRFYPFDSILNWLGGSRFWIWCRVRWSLISWPRISSIDSRLGRHSGQVVGRLWISNIGFIDFITLGKKGIETNDQIGMTLK